MSLIFIKKEIELKDAKNKLSDHAVFNEKVWLYLEKKHRPTDFSCKKKHQIIILKKIQQTNKESGRGKYIVHA